jgi:hypothetical protein
MHWGVTHERKELDTRFEVLRRLRDDKIEMKRYHRMKNRAASF